MRERTIIKPQMVINIQTLRLFLRQIFTALSEGIYRYSKYESHTAHSEHKTEQNKRNPIPSSPTNDKILRQSSILVNKPEIIIGNMRNPA